MLIDVIRFPGFQTRTMQEMWVKGCNRNPQLSVAGLDVEWFKPTLVGGAPVRTCTC